MANGNPNWVSVRSAPISVGILNECDCLARRLTADHRLPVRLKVNARWSHPAEVLADINRRRCQVAILDHRINNAIRGHQLIAALTERGIGCVVLTNDLRRLGIRLAVLAGARGLASRLDPVDQLATVIGGVADGATAVSSGQAAKALARSTQLPSLSKREVACLRLVGEGHGVKVIGKLVDPPIAMSSVKTYPTRTMQKYADVGRPMRNSTQAVLATLNDGWFDLIDDAGEAINDQIFNLSSK